MSIQTVLIVDDEPDIRELLEITLGRMKLVTTSAATVGEAKALLREGCFDLCLTDMRLPDGDGIELVAHIQRRHPDLPVAVITAYGSMDTAVAALKAGAFDFVSKPVDLAMLRNLVNSALRLPHGETAGGIGPAAVDEGLTGESTAIRALRTTIAKLARSQAPVCILGESGSGKERAARAIHQAGPRADQPFVPVNCGAIPQELMESEFFGHVKGSFTGAAADKPGLFQAAQGGTLFLDEIADLPLHMQVKLLRAIQERAVKPVGAQQEIPVDVRILSATHKDLPSETAAGRFRQDLYYRIDVIELRVPPLRERMDDLPPLAAQILARIAARWGETPPTLAREALEKLASYHYPGNVRELENILERAATLCEVGTVHASDIHLPDADDEALGQILPNCRERDDSRFSGDNLCQDENPVDGEQRSAILKALERHRWNRTAAARELGMTLRQLRYRLEKMGVE